MGTRPRPKAGDIFGVWLSEESAAAGIVLHVSTYFKGSMMVGFYDRLFTSIDRIDLASIGGKFIDTPNYTGVQAVNRGRWRIIANSQDLLAAASIPELRVAYTLFFKDQALRQLSSDELSQYVELAGQGVTYIENRLREHFSLLR